MDCSIIIPNYNGAQVLSPCLEALYHGSTGLLQREIVVVDNGSSDHSRQLLAENYPAVRVIPLARNTGFTGGIHAGVQASSGSTLVFLNNDTAIDYYWQEELLKPLDDPRVAAVGGLMLSADERGIDYGGGTANLFGWGFQSLHGQPTESAKLPDTPIPQLFVCGGNMAIRRAVWDQVGGFDNDYFAFFEDVDLGWRLNLAGYQVLFTPHARVAHQQSATAKLMPKSLRAFLTERNALATMVKNLSDANFAELLPWGLGLGLERALLDLDLERDRVFAGRWGDDVFDRKGKSGAAVLAEGAQHLKEEGKRLVKETLLHEGNQAERGQARLLAMEAVLADWPKWVAKRKQVQALRKVGDKALMGLMGDLLRPPLGHPREQALLAQLATFLAGPPTGTVP